MTEKEIVRLLTKSGMVSSDGYWDHDQMRRLVAKRIYDIKPEEIKQSLLNNLIYLNSTVDELQETKESLQEEIKDLKLKIEDLETRI